jgi:hypothetical protein
MPAGYVWIGGGTPLGGGARDVVWIEYRGQPLLVYDSVYRDSARNDMHRVLDAVAQPPLGDSLTLLNCGSFTDVFAVVPLDTRTAHPGVRKAWRADSATARLVPLPPRDVICERIPDT